MANLVIIDKTTSNDVIADAVKRLYSLRPLEVTISGKFYVTRVPGGWIFEMAERNGWHPVFVPFHNEFEDYDLEINTKDVF